LRSAIFEFAVWSAGRGKIIFGLGIFGFGALRDLRSWRAARGLWPIFDLLGP
jgi:hypothetical protein